LSIWLEIERRKRFVAALPLTAEDINVIESTVSRVNVNLDALSRASAGNRDAETEAGRPVNSVGDNRDGAFL